MRLLYGLLAVVLVGFLAWGTLAVAPVQASTSAGCGAMNNSALDTNSNGNSVTGAFAAGDSLSLSANPPGGSAGAWLSVNGVTVDTQHPIPGTLHYTFPADTTTTVEWYANGWAVDWAVSCTSGSTSASSVAQPRCTEMMDLPPTAVVGKFVATATAYWEPALDKATGISFEAGKTLWVVGVDASGQFYKVLLSCSYLWVPINTMAPNDDTVWRSAPLPANVIDAE